MRYINYESFFDLFQFKAKIGQGTYGKVYSIIGNDELVVKSSDINIGFVSEIYFGSVLNHPNILKPLMFSYNIVEMKAYLVFPKCERLTIINFKPGMITDLLSAVDYLQLNLVNHCDLRLDNLMKLGDRLTIIDLGLSRFAYPVAIKGEIEYYYRGDIGGYKSEEFDKTKYNHISDDAYSAARILNSLPMDNPDYVNAMLEPAATRPNLTQVLKSLNINQQIELVDYANVDCKVEMSQEIRRVFSRLSLWILEIGSHINSLIETVFLASDLLFRVLPIIFPNCSIDQLEISNLRNLSAACIELATMFIEKYCIGINWSIITEESVQLIMVNRLLIKVIEVTDGKIFRYTYWNYISSKDRFIDLYSDMIRNDYNPKLIRKFDCNVNRKDIFLSEVIPSSTNEKWWRDLFTVYNNILNSDDQYEKEVSNIKPIITNSLLTTPELLKRKRHRM